LFRSKNWIFTGPGILCCFKNNAQAWNPKCTFMELRQVLFILVTVNLFCKISAGGIALVGFVRQINYVGTENKI
jgi:hypothetical protein